MYPLQNCLRAPAHSAVGDCEEQAHRGWIECQPFQRQKDSVNFVVDRVIPEQVLNIVYSYISSIFR